MTKGSTNTYWLLGVPFAGGAYCVMGDNIIGGLDVAYTPFPELIHLWGPQTTISGFEFDVHLKYIFSHCSRKSFYGKLGVKTARLSSSTKPGKGLFGGTVGTFTKTKTEYAPGAELALGFIKLHSGNSAVFIEAVFSCLYMEGKNIRSDHPAAEWKYPRDLIAFGLKFGMMSSILGRKRAS